MEPLPCLTQQYRKKSILFIRCFERKNLLPNLSTTWGFKDFEYNLLFADVHWILVFITLCWVSFVNWPYKTGLVFKTCCKNSQIPKNELKIKLSARITLRSTHDRSRSKATTNAVQPQHNTVTSSDFSQLQTAINTKSLNSWGEVQQYWIAVDLQRKSSRSITFTINKYLRIMGYMKNRWNLR